IRASQGTDADETAGGLASGGARDSARCGRCAGQDFRAGGLYASTRLTGPQRPSGRRHASPVEWPAAAPTSNDFCPDAILPRDTRMITVSSDFMETSVLFFC